MLGRISDTCRLLSPGRKKKKDPSWGGLLAQMCRIRRDVYYREMRTSLGDFQHSCNSLASSRLRFLHDDPLRARGVSFYSLKGHTMLLRPSRCLKPARCGTNGRISDFISCLLVVLRTWLRPSGSQELGSSGEFPQLWPKCRL